MKLLFLLFIFTIYNFIPCQANGKLSYQFKIDTLSTDSLNNSDQNFIQKYSQKLSVKLEGTENKNFIEEISSWLGTKYRMGSNSKKATDCSGFVGQIYKKIYGITLYRISREIIKNVEIVEKKDLKEGDIVFFKIAKKRISHVGIYIKDGKFIHASVSRGVIVSSLNEKYYSKYYYCGGRHKNLI